MIYTLLFLTPKGFSMKLQKPMVRFSYFIFTLFFLCSCVPDKSEPETKISEAPSAPVKKVEKRHQLPVQYQTPSYMVDTGNIDSIDEVTTDITMKVGASIRSTRGPQPLWDILKRLAALKKMSISWASDVDQYVLVDVDISANDDFYAAIDNLLRQVDYYHEINGSTIVVKYKETRQFHIAMPFIKQVYENATGGNVLGSNDASSNIEGTISLVSKGNEFDIWENIKLNLDTIMEKWSYRRESADVEKGATSAGASEESRGFKSSQGQASQTDTAEVSTETGHLQKSAGLGYYIIDQHLGLISVTAPRPILKKVDDYITALTKSIYKQVSIEAKIIEVQLNDSSSIGLNWNLLLKNLTVTGGRYGFSNDRREHEDSDINNAASWTRERGNDRKSTTTRNESIAGDTRTHDFTGTVTDVAKSALTSGLSGATFINNDLVEGFGAGISLIGFTFDKFLNAVKKQGQTTILSNPKLSVLNGQPSLITVGRNVTYIDSIESDVSESGVITLSATTERVLSGVGLAITANIIDDKEIILNLVPVTSELQEPIEYRAIGDFGQVGLPIINVREMSTTVRVQDGEMLVIGGLISNVDENDGTFVPGTSDIPFFKYFFGYEEKQSRKRELIILLKPRII